MPATQRFIPIARAATPDGRPPAWLADAEHDLTAALASARSSVALCEQALARLVDAGQQAMVWTMIPVGSRRHSAPAVPRLEQPTARTGQRPSVLHLADRLTPREVEVLRLIAAGLSNKEIAASVCLSPRTVERHITNLHAKLGTRSKAEATAWALRHQLP
jgi:DNA-binding NarL/FixJ family response regulator